MLVAKRLTTGKRLKKRLEGLERRVTTLDDTSSSGNEKPSLPTKTKRAQTSKTQSQLPSAQVIPGRYTPPVHHDDEYLFSESYDERRQSHTSPMLTCSEEMTMPPYEFVQGSHLMPTETYPEYLSLEPVSVSLPVVTHFSDAITQKTGYEGSGPVDEDLPPYMSYSSYPLPCVDLITGQPSSCDQMPHVSASSLRSLLLTTSPQGIAYQVRSRC